MPTPDRTTIRAAFDQLVTTLRTNLVGTPPTPTNPFYAVHVGAPGVSDHPRPFLSVNLMGTRSITNVDGDRIMEVMIAMRVVADTTGQDSIGTILDHIGATEDHLDSLVGVGLIDGAEGFDDRAWSFEDTKVRSGPRIVAATAKQTFVVKIQRNQNRTPA